MNIGLLVLAFGLGAILCYAWARIQFRNQLKLYDLRLATVLRQEEIDNALVRERDRIAKIIHDEIGNKLIVLLHELDRNFQQDAFGTAGSQVLWRVIKELRNDIQNTRALVRALSSFELDSNGVAGELQKFCEKKDGFYGVMVGFAGLSGSKRFEFEKEKEIIAMTKELIYNCFKHSGCWHIDVALSWHDARLEVEVSDDGFGVETHQLAESKSSGLQGMRERCKNIGATLDVLKPRRGSRIKITLPL